MFWKTRRRRLPLYGPTLILRDGDGIPRSADLSEVRTLGLFGGSTIPSYSDLSSVRSLSIGAGSRLLPGCKFGHLESVSLSGGASLPADVPLDQLWQLVLEDQSELQVKDAVPKVADLVLEGNAKWPSWLDTNNLHSLTLCGCFDVPEGSKFDQLTTLRQSNGARVNERVRAPLLQFLLIGKDSMVPDSFPTETVECLALWDGATMPVGSVLTGVRNLTMARGAYLPVSADLSRLDTLELREGASLPCGLNLMGLRSLVLAHASISERTVVDNLQQLTIRGDPSQSHVPPETAISWLQRNLHQLVAASRHGLEGFLDERRWSHRTYVQSPIRALLPNYVSRRTDPKVLGLASVFHELYMMGAVHLNMIEEILARSTSPGSGRYGTRN